MDFQDKQLVLRIVKALPFIYQPDRVAPKASDVSAADWLYQHTWKKYDIFSRVLLRLFSGPEIPVEHRSLCAKVTLYPFLIIV